MFFASSESSRASWSPSTKKSCSVVVCTSSRSPFTALTTSFGVEDSSTRALRSSAAAPADTTVACQVCSPALSTTRRATPASDAAVSFTDILLASHTGTGGVTTAPSTRTSSQSGSRPEPALAPREEEEEEDHSSDESRPESSESVPRLARAVRHALSSPNSSPSDDDTLSSSEASALSTMALRSISFPAVCSYACTSRLSSALGKTPATVMNPALGSETRVPASTTRVLPLGAAPISSAVISRPVIRDVSENRADEGDGDAFDGAPSASETAAAVALFGEISSFSSETSEVMSAAIPTRAASRRASSCASFFASRRRPSSAAPAASASSAVAAVATAAVPTRRSPTNTARRTGGEPPARPAPLGPARTFTRSLSPSLTVTEAVSAPFASRAPDRDRDWDWDWDPNAPPRAICMVSSRVHTETTRSRRASTASSLPLILAKTPLASPPGATRRSEPNATAPPPRANASSTSAKRTVTAARTPSPSPATTTAGASTGGSTIHWPARGAVTSSSCVVVPGAAPSRVMCENLGVARFSSFCASATGDTSRSGGGNEGMTRGEGGTKDISTRSSARAARARSEPDLPPITNVATRTGSSRDEEKALKRRSSVSASVSARTRRETTSPRASCFGAPTTSPFTTSSAQGKCSDAKRASPSRRSRCATACGASSSNTRRVAGVSVQAPGATTRTAVGADAEPSPPNKSKPFPFDSETVKEAATSAREGEGEIEFDSPAAAAARPSASFRASASSARVAASSLSRGSDFERNAAARDAARAFSSSRVIVGFAGLSSGTKRGSGSGSGSSRVRFAASESETETGRSPSSLAEAEKTRLSFPSAEESSEARRVVVFFPSE